MYRFLGKIETDNFTVSKSEITTFVISLFGITSFLEIEFPMNSRIKKTSPKVFKTTHTCEEVKVPR